MRRRFTSFVLALALSLPALLVAQAPAAGVQAPAAPQAGPGRGPAGPAAPANVPRARDDARHRSFVDIARAGGIDLLFVGDSITDWFYYGRGDNPATGGKVWAASIAPLKPANFGIAGDTTQGVLWRMQNGELDGFTAKLIVLMLGTNNINRNPTAEIVDGNRLIVEEFKKRQPQAKVLVLGVFPRSNVRQPDQTPALRAAIKDINTGLAKLADGRQVFFMDIGDTFLAADGSIPADVMADGLHPTEKGYQLWADAMLPRVRDLLK